MDYEIEQSNNERCAKISDKMFPILKDLNVLELGSMGGTHFTTNLFRYTSNITAIEFDLFSVHYLKRHFPTVKVIHKDFNECLPTVGEFDAVVIYGILYHSHAPLKIIEDVANFVKPKFILLESVLGLRAKDDVSIWEETPNLPGKRYSERKTCGLVINLGQSYYDFALGNLGYEKIDEFDVATDEYLMSTPGELKKPAYYSTWKLQ
jgi:SAM-dependent methyltransferase